MGSASLALVAARAAVGAAHARLRIAEEAHVRVLERGLGHFPNRGRAEREAAERAVGKARRCFDEALAALEALEARAAEVETEEEARESLRRRRHAAGLSVGQLARLARVPVGDVVGAEPGLFGRRAVDPATVRRILAALDAVEVGDAFESPRRVGGARWMTETLREIAGVAALVDERGRLRRGPCLSGPVARAPGVGEGADLDGVARRSVTGEGRAVVRVRPVSLNAARSWIAECHRHLRRPVTGWLFGVEILSDDGERIGVACAGRPASRMLQDGETCEITRVAVVEGHRNACSFAYGALRRAAAALGYARVVTYTLADEPGSSLRAAGFVDCGPAGGGEADRPSRRRGPVEQSGMKRRWEWRATAPAPPREGDRP